MTDPDRNRISEVAELIAPYVRRTPLIEIDAKELGLPPASLGLKLELMQHAGSFKTRGAFTNLLLRTVPEAGVTAASGGNHGSAVAYAAMALGKRAKIFVPVVSSPPKIERIRRYGADLVIEGERYSDALAACERWNATAGALPVHAFDQPETILGQATLGREIEQQLPSIDTILVAVGGGGLLSGIASWFQKSIRIIGVEPEGAPTLTKALEAGHPVDAPTEGIASDSLAPRRIGERNFPILQRFVDRVVLVSDESIRNAQKTLWERLSVVAEPGGAATTAALLSGAYTPQPGERVCVLVSGGNTSAVNFTT